MAKDIPQGLRDITKEVKTEIRARALLIGKSADLSIVDYLVAAAYQWGRGDMSEENLARFKDIFRDFSTPPQGYCVYCGENFIRAICIKCEKPFLVCYGPYPDCRNNKLGRCADCSDDYKWYTFIFG